MLEEIDVTERLNEEWEFLFRCIVNLQENLVDNGQVYRYNDKYLKSKRIENIRSDRSYRIPWKRCR